jgi:hypothetical protein
MYFTFLKSEVGGSATSLFCPTMIQKATLITGPSRTFFGSPAEKKSEV